MRGRVAPGEPEAGAGRVVGVEVRVADVVVGRRGKAYLEIGEPVLEHGEVGGDAEPFPEILLVAERPIRAAADEPAPPLGRPHELDGYDTRRLAALQRAVDVEADESDHAGLRSGRSGSEGARRRSRARPSCGASSARRRPGAAGAWHGRPTSSSRATTAWS